MVLIETRSSSKLPLRRVAHRQFIFVSIDFCGCHIINNISSTSACHHDLRASIVIHATMPMPAVLSRDRNFTRASCVLFVFWETTTPFRLSLFRSSNRYRTIPTYVPYCTYRYNILYVRTKTDENKTAMQHSLENKIDMVSGINLVILKNLQDTCCSQVNKFLRSREDPN